MFGFLFFLGLYAVGAVVSSYLYKRFGDLSRDTYEMGVFLWPLSLPISALVIAIDKVENLAEKHKNKGEKK